MKKIIFSTGNSYAPIALRVLLSAVMFPHGAQKLLGWFGGFGFEGTMGFFTQQMGLPWTVGFLVVLIEFFGPIFILAGLATRVWSLGMLSVMTGIIITTFHQHFFMNWFGNQAAEGFEFFLLGIGMSLSLLVSGSGRLSVDRLITQALRPATATSLNIQVVKTARKTGKPAILN